MLRFRTRWGMIAVCIVLLAAVLRLFRLGDLPAGLSWDEAAIGYNGYAIFQARRDEWLERLPVTFKSFGDYKAAAAIYANALSTAVVGLTPFGIRLPMALAGIFTVVAVFLVAMELFRRRGVALLAMFFAAVSPWNVHFSRIAFESGIAVAAVSWGLYFFLRGLKQGFFLVLSGFCFVVSLYAYHSPKIFLPIFGVLLILRFRRELLKQKKWLVVALSLSVALAFPLLRESISGKASERLYGTSILLSKNGLRPLSELIPTFVSNSMAHADPAFLLFGKTFTYRHGNGVFGVLSPFEALGVLFSVFLLIRGRFRENGWLWTAMLTAFLPAVISDGAPHSNRAHLAMPFLSLIAAFGVVHVLDAQKVSLRRLLWMVTIAGTLLFVVWAAGTYERVFRGVGTADFQYGYLDAVRIARSEEKNVDKIVFTNRYGQAYVYILLGKKINPIEYQHGALANYEIRDVRWEEDRNRPAVLLIGSPTEIPESAEGIVNEVKNPSGEVVFRIVRTGVRQ